MTFSGVPLLLLLLGTTTIFNVVKSQGALFNITSNPDNQTICVGGEAVMHCGYTSTTVISVVLVYNHTIPHTRHSQDLPGLPTQFIQPLNDTTATRIIVGPVGEESIGMTTITCIYDLVSEVVNTTTAILTIIGSLPGSPTTLSFSEVRLDGFTITWSEPLMDADDICGPVQFNVTLDGVMTTTTTMTNFTFSGLRHTASYTVFVISFNNAGSSPPANITVATLIGSAPFPPIGVQLNLRFVDGDVSIAATWMAPQLAINMTEILNYNLMLTVNSTAMFNSTVAAGTTTVDIFRIFSDASRAMFTDYSLSVAAVNSIGPGNFTAPVSVMSKYMYIQEVMVSKTTEDILVLCSVMQSQPALACQAVFYCVDNGSSSNTTLSLSNGVARNLTTSQLCNITIQVVLSSDTSQVLEESVFYNVSPYIQPTPSASPLPPPDRDSNTSGDSGNSGATIAGIVVGVVMAVAIAIAVFILLLLCYQRHCRMKNKPSSLHCSNPGNKSGKQIEVDNRDGSSSSQDDTDSPGSTAPIIPPYSTVHVVKTDNHNNKISFMETAVVSQYSQVEDEAIHASNGNAVSKKGVRPQYSMVHKPTKAEGKVDNYTELATIGPYPSKKAPEESVEYTDVIPSNLKEPPQYSNMEHHHYANGSTAFTHTHQQ